MLIESEYLKRQIRDMAKVVEECDPGGTCPSHHAYNMVRTTMDSILETIEVLERYARRAYNDR